MNYSQSVPANQDQQVDFDDQLMKAYIGPKSEFIYDCVKKNQIFHWKLILHYLFWQISFAYRKMYLPIIIALCIGIILISLGQNIAGFSVFLGISFIPMYKWDIQRKLKKLKNQNQSASQQELLEKAAKIGGTSLAAAILFPLVSAILIFFFLVITGG